MFNRFLIWRVVREGLTAQRLWYVAVNKEVALPGRQKSCGIVEVSASNPFVVVFSLPDSSTC